MADHKDAPIGPDAAWQGKVLVSDEQAVFIGRAGDASLHESPAIKICISIEGTFGLAASDTSDWSCFTGAVIPAGRPHAIAGGGNGMAMLLIAPESDLARPLHDINSARGITMIDPRDLARLRALSVSLDSSIPEKSQFESACREIVDTLGSPDASAIDPRVARSIDWIRSSPGRGLSTHEIADGVELSESRFAHLFSEYVRVPVRRYLLWLRLRDAMHLLARGHSLTETAHEAGFADSAHLARTFRALLGIAPSSLTRESSIISFLE